MERTTISDLPVEIFIQIFEKLESPEIFKVAEVCKHWYTITQHAAIVSKTIIRLKRYINRRFECNSVNIDFFLNSSRKFHFEVDLCFNLPENFVEFADKFAENIIHLDLYEINQPILENLNIESLKNLRNLKIVCNTIPSSLMSNLVNLKSLKHLTLSSCSFESILPDDLHLNITSLYLVCVKYNVLSLLSFTPNLKTLRIHTSFDIKKNERIFIYLSNPILTKSLTELYLFGVWSVRREWYKYLNLKMFSCIVFDDDDIEIFLVSQMNLTYLYLGSSNTILNDKLLQIIFKNLLHLRVLVLDCEHGVCTDFGITGNPEGFPMSRLEKLKGLGISGTLTNITNASIRHIESMKNLEKVIFKKSENYTSNNPIFHFIR